MSFHSSRCHHTELAVQLCEQPGLIDEFRRCNDPPLVSLDTVLEPGALSGERVTSSWADRRFVHDTMTLVPVNAALVPRPPRDVL